LQATAIVTGRCHTVLMACAEPTVSSASRASAVEKMTAFGHPEFELPYGISLPAFYALIARRHMHEFGTTCEQFAKSRRRHAPPRGAQSMGAVSAMKSPWRMCSPRR
jgi:acetyl-CoA acetyltransferase